MKKFVLLAGLAATLLLAALGLRLCAALTVLALFVWLALETRARTRFRFSTGPALERTWELPAEVLDLRCGAEALFAHPGAALSLVLPSSGRVQSMVLERPPMAVLPLAADRFLVAFEERLSLRDTQGREVRGLDFEPPLARQSYRLLASADGRRGGLLTPWFFQAFDLSLERLLGRVRYEDAGHYFKDAALARSGGGLLLAGTFLPPGEEGAALEARWDWWQLGEDGKWTKAWSRSTESYDNSHLRSVQVGGEGAVLCAEIWHSGYGFELRSADGSLLWERSGAEHPVLSPQGNSVAWELGASTLVVSDSSGKERWRHPFTEQLRLKRVADDGSCTLLEGRCLRRFSPTGVQAPEIWLKHDATHLAFDAQGTLVLAEGLRAASVRGRGAF